MSNVTSVKVTGLSELNEALGKLADDVAIKYLRGATAAGAALIRDAARENVPVRSGKLKRSIYSKWIREESSRERQTFFVSVRRGKQFRAKQRVSKKGRKTTTKDQDAYYWTWVEFGHIATRKRIKGGARKRADARSKLRSSGATFVPPRPFMRPAFEQNKLKAVEAIRSELAKRILEGLKGK